MSSCTKVQHARNARDCIGLPSYSAIDTFTKRCPKVSFLLNKGTKIQVKEMFSYGKDGNFIVGGVLFIHIMLIVN